MVYRFQLQLVFKNHIAWLEHEKGGQFPLHNTFFYEPEEKNSEGLYIKTPIFCSAFVLILRFGILVYTWIVTDLKHLIFIASFIYILTLREKKSNKILIYLEPMTLDLL